MKHFIPFMLIVSLILVSCASAKETTELLPVPTSVAPPADENSSTLEIPSADLERIRANCSGNKIADLVTQGYGPGEYIQGARGVGQTVATLTNADFEGTVGTSVDQSSVDNEIQGEISLEVSRIAGTNPGVRRVIVPEYVNAGQILSDSGGNLPFEVVSYSPDMDIRGNDTLLVSPYLGKERRSIAIWKNPVLTNRSDGSALIRGTMMMIAKNWETGGYELWSIPGQGLDSAHADIAIVDGCSPLVVRVKDDGNVTGILISGNFDNDMMNDPQRVWVEPRPTQSAPEPVPTSPIPEVVTEIQNQNIPGVTVDQNGAHIQTASGVIDIPLNQISERLVFDKDNSVFRVKNGETTVAIFDPTVKSERWGGGREWILRSNAIKLDNMSNWHEEMNYEDYHPDNYVQIELGKDGKPDWEALNVALHLGYLFAQDTYLFSSEIQGVNPVETVTDYYDKFNTRVRDGINPIGYRDDYHMPFKYINNIIFDHGNGVVSAVLQEAIKNYDGSVGVFSFGASDIDAVNVIHGRILGMRIFGTGSEGGKYVMPSFRGSKELIDMYYNRIFKEKPENRQFIDSSGNFLSDPEIERAINIWLTTGNLPTTIKGVQTELLVFGGAPYAMIKK